MNLEKLHGRFFVISGPSGVGKGCIVQEVLKHDQNCVLSISYSSREPRQNEQNGKDYYFVSREEFLEMTKQNKFLEYAEVHGNLYGTSKEQINNLLKSGKTVLFEVDIQGGISLKKFLPEVTTIFITPPTKEELINRINNRGSETEETLHRRLQTMQKEMNYAAHYDYQVINDKLDAAVHEVLKIINTKRKALSK